LKHSRRAKGANKTRMARKSRTEKPVPNGVAMLKSRHITDTIFAPEAINWLVRSKIDTKSELILDCAPDLHRNAFLDIFEALADKRLQAYVLDFAAGLFQIDPAQFERGLDGQLPESAFLLLDQCRVTIRTVEGRDVCGEIRFFVRDLGAAFTSGEQSGPAKNPLPRARERELKDFVIDYCRQQQNAGRTYNDDSVRVAAESHFNARITREPVRKIMKDANCLGQAGRPKIRPKNETA
jgi:hypothetical protein